MNELEIIHRFQTTLPAVAKWIDTTLEDNINSAVSVATLPFPRLAKAFPHDLLERAKVVVTTGKVPFPPLAQMGLPELRQIEDMQMAGITYNDTFFVSHLHQTESLHFHELVHVVQWERLGVNDFLLAYGAGLMQFGYIDSPLEKMAYSLQAAFDRGTLPPNIIEVIRQSTEAIWSALASLFPNK